MQKTRKSPTSFSISEQSLYYETKFNPYKFLLSNSIFILIYLKIEQISEYNKNAYAIQQNNNAEFQNSSTKNSEKSYEIPINFTPSHVEILQNNKTRQENIGFWKKFRKQNSAAIIIQKNYKMFKCRKKFIDLIYSRYIGKITPHVKKIQNVWRRYKAIKACKMLAFYNIISEKIMQSGDRITGYIKMKNVQKNTKYCLLSHILYKQMDEAAKKIQSLQRMWKTRKLYLKIVGFEHTFSVIKYIKPAKSVEIVGTFTKPIWKVKLKLDYCKLRNIFVKYLANLGAGNNYQYMLIIDGIRTNVIKILHVEPRSSKILGKSLSRNLSHHSKSSNISSKEIKEIIPEPNSSVKVVTPDKKSPLEIAPKSVETETATQTVTKTWKDIEKSIGSEPESEFLAFQISKKEQGSAEKPIKIQEEDKIKETEEDLLTLETERQTIEKGKTESGKTDINFDFAFDNIADDYYN